MFVDLHGKTIHNAWKIFNNAIVDAHFKGARSIVVVTGKGQMQTEFDSWCSNHPKVSGYELRKDGGSYLVKLLKRKRLT
tara:strand:- start:248 stop:484 length:237 start_codon:yes stop_codon:yes gene_type:complete